MKPILLVIAGPTGVGKSELSVALAERFGGEVVGADSMQVYRGLDAGTAKPPVEARARVPHHLIDVVEPGRDYSAGDYARDADAVIAAIVARGRLPIVVGGTGLYLRALLRGLVEAPRRQPELRDRLNRMAERRGARGLRRLLRRLDPEAAQRIGEADRQRLVRAAEVALSGGVPLARLIREHGFSEERYPALRLGVDMDDAILLPRLRERVRRMFADDALLREVEGLLAAGVSPGANAFKALGYREAMAVRRGELARGQAEEITLRNSRRYVKRQRTWFRREPGFRWFRLSGGPGADRPPIEAWVASELADRC